MYKISIQAAPAASFLRRGILRSRLLYRVWTLFKITNCNLDNWFYLLFYNQIFSQGKKEDKKSNRINIKTIRFDKKKWKDNLVLHYLISKWIFFLITFRRHQDLQILISPKSLILQRKKFLQNDARIQRRLKRLGFCRKI